MNLDPEQQQAVMAIWEWMKRLNTPYFTMGGYAGTGKTTLMATLRKLMVKANPKLKIAFCAYTGKASRVLKTTLQFHQAIIEGDTIGTIHSLIYAPIDDGGGGKIYWKKKEQIKADLVIVDEASMVDERIWHDLLSFGLPILAVGDHGQLPPISGRFNLMAKPMIKLETIYRQAQGNPIIEVSVMARETGKIPVGHFGDSVRKLSRYEVESGIEVEDMLRSFNEELLVLSGYNHTRVKLNQQIRQYLGFELPTPQVQDRVICLKNNWEKGIYNGMLGYMKRLIPIDDQTGQIESYSTEIQMVDEDIKFEGLINAYMFGGKEKTETQLHKRYGEWFDFGYALTVHKAQGSQAPKVLLFEERFPKMSDDDWRRWLYTAVTRAQEELTIVGI